MPVTQRVDIPFGTFIAHGAQRKTSIRTSMYDYKLQRNPNTSTIERMPKQSRSSIIDCNVDSERPKRVDGNLEMQRMLLQDLARRENAAKGFGPQNVPFTPVLEEDVDRLKKDTVQALRPLWGR